MDQRLYDARFSREFYLKHDHPVVDDIVLVQEAGAYPYRHTTHQLCVESEPGRIVLELYGRRTELILDPVPNSPEFDVGAHPGESRPGRPTGASAGSSPDAGSGPRNGSTTGGH